MELPLSQIHTDRDRFFDDWSEPIQFRRILESYDPQTQTISETVDETTLRGIVGATKVQPKPGTGGHQLTEVRSILVKSEELPFEEPAPICRVVYSEREYEVREFQNSAENAICTLECRRDL